MTATDLLNQRLAGRYTIERELGRGGMATVYLARDIKHDRHVALKVLDPELGAVLGGERFLSEIRVTAHLQHPNLLPLFDSGDVDGMLFYVMPFVAGESLRAKLEREQQLPVDEAVHIAVAIAGAVDYAHRHGVVHRDLKPENILLHDGEPLVADFGIALAVTNAGGGRITQTGLSLGTPQYMSPEQATGDRAVDGRTDVYSLGAMTYEMLSGEAPHTGKTAQAIIAKLMTEEPRPVTALRRTIPAHVGAAVHRALQKLPADRFSTARDFGEALQGRGAAPTASVSEPSSVTTGAPWKAIAIGALIVAAVATVAAVRNLTRANTTPAALRVRYPLTLPDSVAVNNVSTAMRAFDLSPDGTQLAYVGGPAGHLYIKRLDELLPRELVSERVGMVRFSPGGDQIGFLTGTTLKRIAVAGGPVTRIAEGVGPFAWGGGTIVFGAGGNPSPALYRVSENGGATERITPPPLPDESVYGIPSFLPDGDGVLFPILSSGKLIGPTEVAVIRLSDRRMTRLGIAGTSPVYLPTGHVLAIDLEGTGTVTPFDLRSLKVTGPPFAVLQNVQTKSATIADIAVSGSGVLAYVPGEREQEIAELDRGGLLRSVGPVARRFRYPRYSPDKRRIAVMVGQPPSSDIWVLDAASATLSRLTTDGNNVSPEWSPDGKRIAWLNVGANPGTYWRPWDLSGPPELLTKSGVMGFSPKGDFMVTNLGPVVASVSLDSDRRQTPIMTKPGVGMGSVSPDGKWLAYTDVESGIREVYIRSLTGTGATSQISNNGGFEPAWNPRGGELFYRSTSHLISAKLDMSNGPHVIRRDTLFLMRVSFGVGHAQYDVSADGNHFLMPKPITGERPVVIVTGWLDELRERLRTTPKK